MSICPEEAWRINFSKVNQPGTSFILPLLPSPKAVTFNSNRNPISLLEYSIPLPWSTRMKIALGAAQGLAFLHGAEKPVIYRDFKASNILLDSVSILFCSDTEMGSQFILIELE